MASPRIYTVAAEPSGDLLAREVIDALKACEPGVELAGIGGEESAKVGIKSAIDIAPLSILGLFEGLKAYSTVVKLADEAADDIVAYNPDVVVLIDSWGFMLRVAQRVRTRAPHIKLVKLVGPQVWATRAGRAKTLAQTVDHLICLHAMEVPYYAPHGLPVTVMGNPALSRTQRGDGAAFRKMMGIADDTDIVLVLPGSRPSEIKSVAPDLIGAARKIKDERPDTAIIVAPAPSMAKLVDEQFPGIETWSQRLPADANMRDVMAAADLALACSGTVTSELAVQGTPFLVGYRVGWITWMLARYLLYKPTHITLLNIAADDTEVAPEFVQTRLSAGRVASTALDLLSNPAKREAQRAAQNQALARMGERDEPAAMIAADAILSVINAR